jgi:hypothetical protein
MKLFAARAGAARKRPTDEAARNRPLGPRFGACRLTDEQSFSDCHFV